ncbi:hypothetical protein ACIRQY_29120 [Streptomyces sp. NPDC101490]|uniref:hypothetical protein n=1 Tax=Streptomyces sp. NPDC101490 TaxID=3366143 RepID=UPI00383095B9
MAVTLAFVSRAAALGYGNWQAQVSTDPAAAQGTAYSLVLNAGAGPLTGTLDAFGFATVDTVRRISAGPKTATVTVTGHGDASARWTMEALAWGPVVVDGRSVSAEGAWCVSGGGPAGSGTDALLDWGDGTTSPGTMTAPTWTTGRCVFALHQYPQQLQDRTYTLRLTSGAQSIQRAVTVLGTGRAILRPSGGATGAVADIVEWPQRDYQRSAVVLPVVGRTDPVVMVDALRAPSSTLTLLTRTPGEALALLAVLRLTEPLQLLPSCPAVESVWLMVLAATPRRLTNSGTDVRRVWDVEIQEVAAP